MEDKNNNIFVYLLIAVIIIAAGVLGFIVLAEDTPDYSNEDEITDNTKLEEEDTVLNQLKSNENLATFFSLIAEDTTLSNLLNDKEKQFTIFAPQNEAFAEISETTSGLTNEQLKEILKYHIVEGKLMSADINANTKLITLNGQELEFSIVDDEITVIDASGNSSVITDFDNTTDDGVIHIVKSVLIPELGSQEVSE